MIENSTVIPCTRVGGGVASSGSNELDNHHGTYWMAYYFYSTGTEKDTLPMQLDLLSDGVIQVCTCCLCAYYSHHLFILMHRVMVRTIWVSLC